ncbi:hypothetical protein [Cycloclasticus pugetii]|uniref:hypothetical protein n=1 Tax=Cycloclasticus pugetii TaxID=34068 RepID=UPI00036831B2|nr:hypothetical protein [Cycloclasticus pugetii]
MEYIEVVIGTIALAIAVWALHLQKKEIIKNGKINSLIHSASLIQEKIDYHSKIIDDLKSQGKTQKEWGGHAVKINSNLRPLKERINVEFLNIASKYDGILHEKEIRDSLNIKS